jgi:hypothetical protein
MHDNYKKANAARRCTYERISGQTCTQPALRNHVFCRFHEFLESPQPDARLIPFVEDAASLQFALMQVIKSLQLGKIDRPTANSILYALQIAAQNLNHFCEETGHPYARRTALSKREQEEEELENQPSLAEILLQRLQELTDDETKDEKSQEENPAVAAFDAPTAPNAT